MSLEQQVRQFNDTYQVPTAEKPRLPTSRETLRILDLLNEEYQETSEALESDDLVHIAKELGDILYVTAQQMVTIGLPVDAILRAIQESNMSKLDEQGNPIFREDGKVRKGPNFFKAEPAIAKLLVAVSDGH